MSESIIEIENLSLTLPANQAQVNILRGVSLRVAAGEKLALLGPSGSGKTTLLLALAGLLPASAGRICVAGKDYATLDEAARTRFRGTHIGIVFQSFHLIGAMSALENIMLPLELTPATQDTNPKTIRARALELLEEVGLSARAHHRPAQLSGGEQQRVALARALIAKPPLLLADEPTGNLDQKTGGDVLALIMRLAAQQNTTLFMITHDSEVARACDRALEIRDGKIIDDTRG